MSWFVKVKIEYIVKTGDCIWSSYDNPEDADKEAQSLREDGYLDAHVEVRKVGGEE
jgi:hypothetical protein